MRQSIAFLIVLGIAIMVGLFIVHVPSFLLLEIGHFSVAMPLWLLLALIVLVSFIVMLIRRLVQSALVVPQRLRGNIEIMRQRQQLRKKITQIEIGIKRARARV